MAVVINKSAEVIPTVPTLTQLASALSNNAKPALTGTGAIGSLITIMDGTKILGTTTVDSNGNWAYTPNTALTDGVHQLAAKASSSPTSTVFSAATSAFAYTVDTKPPATPIITTKTTLTNNAKISLSGTAEAGATIKIMDAGVLVATFAADSKGAWAYAPTIAYKDGAHSFTVTATDAAGNQSPASTALALTIDATAPDAPTVTTASTLTNNFKPVLSGTAEAKSTVKIYDNGTALGTAVADATGKWTYTPSTAFNEGGHAITVRATDAAGNMSIPSNVLNVVTTSKILSAWGVAETLSGQDGKSQTLRPTLAGYNGDKVWTEVSAASDKWTTQGYIEAKVSLQTQDRLGGLLAGETLEITTTNINNRGIGVFASSNLYRADPANNGDILGGVWWLDAGSNTNSTYTLNYKSYTFTSFSAANNAGSITDIGDTQILLSDIDLSKLGNDKNFNYNWAYTPTGFAFEWDELVSGSTTEKVANIALFDATGTQIGATYVSDPMAVGILTNLSTDPYGNYDFLTLDRLSDAPKLALTTMKADGSQSIHEVSVNFAKDMATTSSGGYNWIYTNKDTAGNFLNIEFAVSGIRNGRAVVDLIQTDTDLNVINTKTVDLYAATNPDNAIGRIRATRLPDTNTTIFGFQVGSTLHLVEMDAKGNIAQDYTQTLGTNIIFDRLTGLNDGRIEISLLTKGATYSAATLVQTQIFDTRTAALNVSGGTGLVAGTSLADTIAMASSNAVVEGGAGADKLSATGKNSTLSYEHSNAAVQINLSKKTAAGGDAAGDTISGFSNVIGSQFADNLTGDANANIFTGGIGNDSIIGGGGADSVVYSGNKADYTITMNKDGTYTVKDNRDGSPDGTDTITAVSLLTFADGTTYTTIDPTKAPVITSKLTLTNNALSSISGTAIAGSTVGLFDGTTLIGTTTADSKGNWVVTPLNKLSEGAHNVTAKTVDSGGNTSAASNILAFTVDTIAPTKPAFVLDAASDTGLSATDKITNAKAPKITGTAEAGSTVTLYDGTKVLGTATAAAGTAGGSFSITSGTLTDGTHVLSVQAKDAVGNTSLLSETITINVDTKAPDAPITPTLDINSDTGLSAIDGITKTATPVVTGTAEAGSKVELFDGAKSVGTATAGADGKYSITTTTLTDGIHKLTVKATDVAGNTSPASSILSVTTDTIGPAIPVLSTKTSAVNTNAPTIAGTAEANATVMIYDDKNVAYGSVTADATGKWSYTVTKLLADGAYQFIVQALDVAGNNSAKSNPVTITVDTSAPDKATSLALAAASDTGLSATDGITKINTPVVTGKAESGSTVTLYEGAIALGKATTGSDGSFSITSSKLTDGNHVLTAISVDTAGNASALSDPLNISVITTAPAAPVITTAGIATTATPTITGTAKPLTTITVMDGTVVLGTAAVDLKGSWSLIVPAGTPLKDGTHNLTVTASDTAGNISKASLASALLVNTQPIEVTIDQLSKYASAKNVASFSVKDTAANIAKNLDLLAATPTLRQIIQTDTPKTVDITAIQYNADLAVFAKFKSNYGLTVTGALIADADVLQKDLHVQSFQISDTIANIKANFDDLNVKIDTWNNLNSSAPILLKDTGNIAVTAAQYNSNTLIKSKLPASTGYEITDIQNDTSGLALSKNANIKIINVADSVGNITLDLDKLNAASNIKSVTFTDAVPSALIITYTQLGADTAALSKLPVDYKLVVKDVPANQIATVTANTHVVSMSVTDSTLNLLSLINGDQKGIGGIIADPKISIITIDETKPSASATTQTTPPVGISIVDAMKIAALPNLSAVPSFKILDTAANIVAHARYDILNVIQHSSKITLSDMPPKLTVADAKVLSDFSSYEITNATMTIAGSAGGSVSLSNGTLTPIATSAGGTYTLTSSSVTGTVTATGSAGNFTITAGTLMQGGKAVAIAGGSLSATPPSHVDANGNPLINGFAYTLFDANTVLLDSANSILVKAAKTVSAIHTYTVAEALQLQTPVSLTSPIAIQDTAENIIAQAKMSGDTIIARASFVIVSDTTAKIGAAIDDLEALSKKGLVTDIKLTDTGVTPTLSPTQLANDYNAIGRILNLSISATNTPTAYAAPTISAPSITNNKQPNLTGTAKPGATIKIYDGTTLLGTVIADNTGLWNFKVVNDLSETTHNLTATASTSDGSRMSPASNAVAMLVDATAPNAPTLIVPAASKNALPTISGTSEYGSTLSIYDGTTLVASTTANALNKWTYTFSKAITDGNHSLTVVATDKAGNASAASAPSVLTVDTIAPNAPIITSVVASNSASTSTLTNTNILNSNTQFYWDPLNGGNGHIYEFVNSLSTWTEAFNASSLKSINGNSGYLLTISSAMENNFIANLIPSKITTGWNNDAIWIGASDSIKEGVWVWMSGPESGTQFWQGNSTGNLVGNQFSNFVLSYLQDENGASGVSGSWSNPTGSGSDYAFMSVKYGMNGQWDDAYSSAVANTTALSPIASNDGMRNAYVIEYGGLGMGDLTKPKISGTAEKGCLVTVYDGKTLLGTTTASSTDGTWSITPVNGLAIGAHSFTATAKDAVGNVSTSSLVSSWVVPDPTPQPVATTLKWTADQLRGYELSATTGSKTASAATVSETASLVGGASYTFAAGYGYSYSGTAPSISLKVLDSSGAVVGTSTTPVNGYTFKASSSGVYTIQLSAINATNTAVLTSYNLIGHQVMSTLPLTSGDTNVDALLMGGTGQWWHTPGTVPAISTATADIIHTGLSSLTAASAQHTLTYSFLTALPAGSSSTDSAGFAVMTATQQAAVKKALDYISTLIDVKFTLSTTAGQGDINFGQNLQSSSAGYANLPYQGGGHPSYLMLASNASTNSDFSMGSYGWETLIHEIGHTLGLKHPGNYNAGGGGTPPPYLPAETDTRRYTLMSYNNPSDSTNVTAKAVTGGTSYSWTSINPQSFMLYDIEALQYLYGSNEATSYQTITFAADYKGMQTIWAPTGGKIDASAMSFSNIIDLRAGYFSSIGIQGPSTLPSQIAAYQTYTGMNNVAIAYGSKVNDAIGGSGNDAFYVNAGSDSIDGGAGSDTVYLSGSASDWTLAGSGASQTATNNATGVVNTLKNIETIAYYDPTVTIPTHTAPSGMLSQSVSTFIQSVAAMAPQTNSGMVLPSNDGMLLQNVTTLTKPV